MSTQIRHRLALAATTLAALFSLHDCSIVRDRCAPGWDAAGPDSPSSLSQWCYKFVYNPRTTYNWYAARLYCKQDDAELLVIDSADEANWLSDVLTTKQGMTGVHIIDHEATFWYVDAHKQLYCDGDESCWRDGRPIADGTLAFARNNKTYVDPYLAENVFVRLAFACYVVQFNGDDYPMQVAAYDVGCSQDYAIGYICKRRSENSKRSIVADAKPRSCTYDEAVDVQCPAGWRKADTPVTMAPHCYKFVPMSKISWDGAYRQCAQQGSELLYVEGAHEARWITSVLNSLTIFTGVETRFALNLHLLMYQYNSWSFANQLLVEHSGFQWGYFDSYDDDGMNWCAELKMTSETFVLAQVPCATQGRDLGYICKQPVCYIKTFDVNNSTKVAPNTEL